MRLQTWWLFFVTVFFLCGTPGPNMLHVLSRSVVFGAKRAVATMLGCFAAVLLALAVSAAGLGALLMASPRTFGLLRYLGAAYLIWLGIKAWRSSDAPLHTESSTALAPALSQMQLFRTGFLVGISNPKLLLFAAAFLPQFIDPTRPKALQFTILVVTFGLCELFWY
ncbi:MAG: LysE family translocator, partial [Brachymonas sp.]|nr:LysE family translocator [Brachymonas sp.]